MTRTHGDYELDDDKTRLDVPLTLSWLQTSYWNPNVTMEKLERSIEHSGLVVGAYLDGTQVGFMRVVTDCVRFGWICDVWVDESHRGQGLGLALTRYALEHPELVDIGHWLLGTRDAHGVYAKAGFTPLEEVALYMRLVKRKSACGPPEECCG